MRSLNWIGNMSNTNEFIFTAKSSPTRTLDDARRRETVVAATGIGSIVTQLAAVYNNVLGTRFKVIYGYPSGPEMTLAMERGEVEGRSTSNPQVLAPTNRRGAGEVQFPDPDRAAKDSAATNPCRCCASSPGPTTSERIFDFISNAVAMARPIVTNAGVPPERVAALRRAFDATLADPAFLRMPSGRAWRSAPRAARRLQQIVAGLLGHAAGGAGAGQARRSRSRAPRRSRAQGRAGT